MSNPQKADAMYVVGDSRREQRRLQDQASLAIPCTRRLFENAGLAAGMRVLDVGSGIGDVAFLAAECVGVSGAVVGVDTNPTVLESARQRAASQQIANVSFVAGDIRNIALDGEFDAVIGRFVLKYLKNPVEAVQHAIHYLHPNGIVAFLELNFHGGGVSVPPSPLFEKILYWLSETFKRARVEMNMRLKLRQTFVAAGLPEPQMQTDVIVGGGSDWSAGYQYAAETLRSALPIMEKLGVATATEVEIETLEARLRDEVVSQNGTLMFLPWVGAWSRKV